MKKLNTVFIVILYVLSFNVATANPLTNKQFISIGKKQAPITIYEFFSFSCSHCAAFHLETLPKLQQDFVEKGLVNIVFVDVPMGGTDILFAHSLLYELSDGMTAKNFASLLFENQNTWLTLNNPQEKLIKYAQLSGLTNEQISHAMNNTDLHNTLVEFAKQCQKNLDVHATPTIIISNTGTPLLSYNTIKSHKKIVGNIPYSELKAKIEESLKERKSK